MSGLIRGAADGAGYLLPGTGLAKAAAAMNPTARMLGEYLAFNHYLQVGIGGVAGLLDAGSHGHFRPPDNCRMSPCDMAG